MITVPSSRLSLPVDTFDNVERRTLSLGALEKTSTRGATVERFTEVPEGF